MCSLDFGVKGQKVKVTAARRVPSSFFHFFLSFSSLIPTVGPQLNSNIHRHSTHICAFLPGAKCPKFWPKFRPQSSSDRRIFELGRFIGKQKQTCQGPLIVYHHTCLLYTSPSPRDRTRSRMPSSA